MTAHSHSHSHPHAHSHAHSHNESEGFFDRTLNTLHDFLHPITEPMGHVYHATVTRFYDWLGNKLGGRANAGRISRRSRMLRLLGNIISTTIIAVTIASMGWVGFWESGALLSQAALFGISIGMGINTIGWLMGAAANHLKIGQFYDAEMELHAENDELRNSHERLTGRHRKFAANAARTLHDINSYTGTALSFVSGIPMALAFISVASYSLSPPLASAFFLASRASALLSVICIWGTNQFRLWAYKKSLEDEMNIYYGLKETADSTRHQTINNIITAAYAKSGILENTKYSTWVKFRCYKALEGAWPEGDLKESRKNKLMNVLSDTLRLLMNSNNGFSRVKLMYIQGKDVQKVSVLDSMPLLETKLFNNLSGRLNKQHHVEVNQLVDECLPEHPEIKTKLFGYHLKRTLIGQKDFTQSKKSLEAKISDSRFFTDENACPSVNTAHGPVFLPYYGTRKVAQSALEINHSKINVLRTNL